MTLSSYQSLGGFVCRENVTVSVTFNMTIYRSLLNLGNVRCLTFTNLVVETIRDHIAC